MHAPAAVPPSSPVRRLRPVRPPRLLAAVAIVAITATVASCTKSAKNGKGDDETTTVASAAPTTAAGAVTTAAAASGTTAAAAATTAAAPSTAAAAATTAPPSSTAAPGPSGHDLYVKLAADWAVKRKPLMNRLKSDTSYHVSAVSRFDFVENPAGYVLAVTSTLHTAEELSAQLWTLTQTYASFWANPALYGDLQPGWSLTIGALHASCPFDAMAKIAAHQLTDADWKGACSVS